MIRRISLLLLLARIGLYDWLGSPWRVVAQIMLPPVYVLVLPALILWNGLEQPAARLAVADMGKVTEEIRPSIRSMEWVMGSRMDEDEAMRRLGQSQFDAVLVPKPDAAEPDGPVPVELRVRDTDFYLWSLLEAVVEGGGAGTGARVLLAPEREAEEGTPPGIVAGFLAVLSIFGAAGVLQQVHADRLAGWSSFLRIAPIGSGLAMSGLGIGRYVVNLLATAYLLWLIHMIVGLPDAMDWPRFIAAIVLVGSLFALMGVALGVWVPAYRGSAETAMQLVWPVLMLPSPIFWDAASFDVLRPLVLANPVTPSYDLLRLTLGAETATYAPAVAWTLTLLWTGLAIATIAARGLLTSRAEARA